MKTYSVEEIRTLEAHHSRCSSLLITMRVDTEYNTGFSSARLKAAQSEFERITGNVTIDAEMHVMD